MKPYFSENNFDLYIGDCVRILGHIKNVDMVFADPPYFLSNGGLSVQSGKIVSVNKGEWDKLNGSITEYNYRWLNAIRNSLKDDGTIWISGTMHNIFSVYDILVELDFKILNVITWKKLNPPPCFSCRFFTHSTEFIIWARKKKKVPHFYNYELMKAINDGKQMKDVWELPSISRWEKSCGKHPTQKPLSLLSRIILSSSRRGELVLDPFSGSGTTGIGSVLFGRRYIGIDIEKEYLDLSVYRYKEAIENMSMANKIYGLNPVIINKFDVSLQT